MNIFVSRRNVRDIFATRADVVDIETENTILQIRENGIYALDAKTKEVILDKDLNLGETIIKKRKRRKKKNETV